MALFCVDWSEKSFTFRNLRGLFLMYITNITQNNEEKHS